MSAWRRKSTVFRSACDFGFAFVLSPENISLDKRRRWKCHTDPSTSFKNKHAGLERVNFGPLRRETVQFLTSQIKPGDWLRTCWVCAPIIHGAVFTRETWLSESHDSDPAVLVTVLTVFILCALWNDTHDSSKTNCTELQRPRRKCVGFPCSRSFCLEVCLIPVH